MFESKTARDNYVKENDEKREAITRDIARRIVGSNVKEEWNETGDMALLVRAIGYYNANYWG